MSVSAFGPLQTPDAVVDLLLRVLRLDDQRLVREHLGELERTKGLRPKTIPLFKTIGRLTDEDERQPQDASPSVLFFLAGLSGAPTINENRRLDARWMIGAEVTYLGLNRTDAIRGAWWLAMLTAQVLVQRTPRDGIVQTLRLTDMEPIPADQQRLYGVRMMLAASCVDVMSMAGATALKTADLGDYDPESPNPYDPQLLPDVVSATSTLAKEPIPDA